MGKKNNLRITSILWGLLAAILVISAALSFDAVQAASGKTIKTVTVKVKGKKVGKKAVSLKKGKSATIKVSTSPKLSQKTVRYQSSRPSVVSVNQKGKLTAKKIGTSTIRVTVKADGYKTKKVTFQLKVTKAASDSASDTTKSDTSSDTNATTGKDDSTSADTKTDTKTPDTTDVTTPSDQISKILVAYFSATNTTKGVAEVLAEVTGAELYEIKPENPYTSADLDYNNDSCRANQEQQDASARPAIEGEIENFQDYGTIYLGFPIWWGEEPRIIDTFLEHYDFSGKTIVPFCTSGGSGIGTAVSNIKEVVSGSPEIKDGRRLDGDVPKATIEEWVGK